MATNLESLSLDELLMKRRSLRRELSGQAGLSPLRIAVLGGSTTNALVEMLELLLLSSGFAPVFYQSEYGRFYEDAVVDQAALVEFRPDIAYLHTSFLNATPPGPDASEADLDAQVESQTARFRQIWDSLESRLSCQIIQNNFELPPQAPLGNMEATSAASRSRFLLRMNEAFAREAGGRARLLIQDVHRLSAEMGLRNWFDWERYYSYKILLTPAANFAVARSLRSMIGAIYGRSRKVLVLDLDNTLWGGVIGDDGPERIQIGRETPVAEAYLAFQEYCLSLRDRGVLLAVCSKNDAEIARKGLEHPSSAIRMEHISCFRANWSPKHENLVEIAQELNLGVDSLVFVDDNPAERAIVEAQLPAVAVPDVGSEVARFAAVIEAGRYFEPASLSREDLARAAQYAANTQRVEQAAKFADYGEYLDSLEMTAEVDGFRPEYIERIAQLTNKTNQYNLTTLRYTTADMQGFAAASDHIGLYGILRDRFGDNGLITVVLGERKGEALELVLWLMSCRVLKREMEFAMLDVLAERAVAAGVRTLRGSYLPTAKNRMVADHYERLGFRAIQGPVGSPEQATFWELDLAGYRRRNQHINVTAQELVTG